MALTAVVGSDGSITMPSSHGGILRQWTATVEYVSSEVTGFADAKNRRYRRGMPQLSGTASGAPGFDAANYAPGVGAGGPAAGSGQGGASLTLTSTPGNGGNVGSWANTVIMRSIALGSDKVGDATISFDFISGDADDLAEVWDVGA